MGITMSSNSKHYAWLVYPYHNVTWTNVVCTTVGMHMSPSQMSNANVGTQKKRSQGCINHRLFDTSTVWQADRTGATWHILIPIPNCKETPYHAESHKNILWNLSCTLYTLYKGRGFNLLINLLVVVIICPGHWPATYSGVKCER
jgi:hypothetical protein